MQNKEIKPLAYNPTKEVKAYAQEHDLDTITSWAILEAKQVGISDIEMVHLMKLFHGYMGNKLTAEQSLSAALQEVLLPKWELDAPEPKTKATDPMSRDHDIIRNLIDKLLVLAEDERMSVNNVSWINDLIDYVEVCYFGSTPDGDMQQKIFDQKHPPMEFRQALNELVVRYNNSLSAIGY